MKENDALNEAIANSVIDQKNLNKEEIEIIKKVSEISLKENKSFLSSLYEYTQNLKNEKSKNRRK